MWKIYAKLLQSGCTILHSHQQNMRISVSLHLSQQLLLSVFLIIAILMSINWYHIVVLISISLLTMLSNFSYTIRMVQNIKLFLW